MALADLVIVMREGRIEQTGPPDLVYRAPSNRFVAEFFASSTVLVGEVEPETEGWSVRTKDGLRLHASHSAKPIENRVSVAIRPENVHVRPLNTQELPADGACTARVEDIRFAGSTCVLNLICGSGRLVARLPSRDAAGLEPGSGAEVAVDARETAILPPEAW